MTQTLRAMICNHAVTVPLWEAQSAGSCQGQASTSLSARMLDFDLFPGRRYIQKVDCGSLSRLQDPYKLWRMLQVIKEKYQVYRNSYGSCSLHRDRTGLEQQDLAHHNNASSLDQLQYGRRGGHSLYCSSLCKVVVRVFDTI